MTTSPVEDAPLYVILRENEEYGPFCAETLLEAMESGNVVEEDWVRKADRTSCWTSVGQLLYGPKEPEPLTRKMRRLLRLGRASLSRAGCNTLSGANRALDNCARPLAARTGMVAFLSAAVATGIAFLPERSIAISIPWILAGVLAGLAMILSRRTCCGIAACLTASMVPLATFQAMPAVQRYFDPNRLEDALPPIGEMYSSMPRKSGDLPKVRSSTKSGIPALGLPMPTDKGK